MYFHHLEVITINILIKIKRMDWISGLVNQ